MARGKVTLAAVGDVSPNREKPESLFELTADVIRNADIAFGQLETNYSENDEQQFIPHAPARSHPRNIAALTELLRAHYPEAGVAYCHCRRNVPAREEPAGYQQRRQVRCH